MGPAPTTRKTYVDPFPGRKGGEHVTMTCESCGGDGIYHAPTGYKDRRGRPYCFDCNGTGKRAILVSSARQTAKRRVEAAVKAEARAATFSDRTDAAEDALREASPEFAAALDAPDDDDGWSESSRARNAAHDATYSVRDGESVKDALDHFNHVTRDQYLPKLLGGNSRAGTCAACGQRVPKDAGVRAVAADRNGGTDIWSIYHGEHIPTDFQRGSYL